jgi:hypothetical protein
VPLCADRDQVPLLLNWPLDAVSSAIIDRRPLLIRLQPGAPSVRSAPCRAQPTSSL